MHYSEWRTHPMGPLRRALVAIAASALLVGCEAQSGGDFFWRAMIDAKAGPPEIAYRNVRVDSMSSTVLSDSDSIGIIVGLRLVDSALVVRDPMSDPLLRILDARTGKLVGSLGTRGQGPGEFQFPPRIVSGGPRRHDMVWLLESSRLGSRGNSGSAAQNQSTPMMPADMRRMRVVDSLAVHIAAVIRDAAWVSDSVIVGTTNSALSVLALLDRNGRLLREIAADSSGWSRVPAEEMSSARTNHLCAAPSGHHVAVAYRWADRIEIFSTDGKATARAQTPHGFAAWVDTHPINRQPYFSSDSPNGRNAYWDCAATDTEIFALFSGKRHKDFRGKGQECSYVHVFGWDGNLRRVIRLDHASASIAVDSAGTILFTGDVVSTKPAVRATRLR